MGVCNLFKAFDSNTNNGQGIFFTFSQYAEDLTTQDALQGNHRVIPSKFVCLDLDIDSFKTATSSTDVNVDLPQAFQSYYENKISYLRGLTYDDTSNAYNWDDRDATKFLFDFLKKYELLSEGTSGNNKYFPEVKYVGDINIYSNENEQNINYNEIYCMVPADAKNTRYWYTSDSNINSFQPDQTSHLNGWPTTPNDNYPTNGLDNIPQFDTGNVYDYSYGGWLSILDEDESAFEVQDDASFDFNCIIILYDVITGQTDNDEFIYGEGNTLKNLPLGIWFSGDVTNDQADLKNKVTKFVRSETIFNQGTSYGLRVCTKHIATPFGTSVVSEVGDYDHSITGFAEVCDLFNQAITQMNIIAQQTTIQTSTMVNYLSQFINRRVNVPYIKEIGGVNYWFVNGRNTGEIAIFEEKIKS